MPASPNDSVLSVSSSVQVPLDEIEITAIRSQGAGGQNVNKVSTGIHLRFDVHASSLSMTHRQRVLATADQRLTKDGVLIIKAQTHRTQEKNREEALKRLQEFLKKAITIPKRRKKTRPSRGSKERRLTDKKRRGQLKAQRGRIGD